MKLLARAFEKGGEGVIKFLPEEEEDMWHVYNIINKGDEVTSQSFRKIVNKSNTGLVRSTKVRLNLTLKIDTIDFDVNTSTIRMKGINTQENAHVKLGQSHTLELSVNRAFSVHKTCWDAIYLERVKIACDISLKAEMAAVVMQLGLAHVCLLTNHMTVVKAKIQMPIPRKKVMSSSKHDKSVLRFYDTVLDNLRKNIKWNVVKCIIIASPGFVKDNFYERMLERAQKEEMKDILSNKNMFVLLHASSGHKHALTEALNDPTVSNLIKDVKATDEVAVLDRFFTMLHSDPERAYYGYNHVVRACEEKAIETMMITDELFRKSDVEQRSKFVALTEAVKAQGGSVLIFSSLHVSGEQLSKMTGIAAILTYPIPEPEDEYSDEDD